MYLLKMFKLFIVSFSVTSLITVSAFASSSSSGNNLSISPIIGVERIQKMMPSPSMKTRTIFGARAVYKFPIVSAEAEYTHGQDSAYDQATSSTYQDTGDKLKLGLVEEFSLGSFMSTHLRGGAQAAQDKLTKTVNGANSTTVTTTKVNPYIGTGVVFHIMQAFSLTADVTVVYIPAKTSGLSDYEVEPSVGFVLSF